jgi:prepilin-type N-terminal cleavage/methylation domain-containing protein
MNTKIAMRKTRQRGFTLMEVLVATVLLLTGLVAVAQLIPIALTANTNNRRDSTGTVVAQRQLSYLLEQLMTTAGPLPADAFGVANTCGLGDPTQPGVTVGSPVINGDRPRIDFTAAKVANYNITTVADPQDPYRATYDIRWAVITSGNGTSASSRRFILGARQTNAQNFVLPLTLDAMVQR